MKLDKYLQQDHPDLYGLPTSEALMQSLKRVMRKQEPEKAVTIKSNTAPSFQQSNKGRHAGRRLSNIAKARYSCRNCRTLTI